jgi:ubiquinone/menaquinone biosynthesis C-methylase UbiE
LRGRDVGCGEGSNTRALARRGARMHAIDIAPTFIRHALSTETADPLGIVFSVADAVALPFADRSFDFVTAFMSMMDVPDTSGGTPSDAARRLSAVLDLTPVF